MNPIWGPHIFSDVGFSTPTSLLDVTNVLTFTKNNQKCHHFNLKPTFLAGWRRPLTCVNCWGMEGLVQLTIVQGPVVLGRLVVWILPGIPENERDCYLGGNSRFEGPKPSGPLNHQLIWWSFETKLIFRCVWHFPESLFQEVHFQVVNFMFIFVSRTGKSKLGYVMFFKSLTNLESQLKMI